MFTCSLCGDKYENQTYSRVHVCQECFDYPMTYMQSDSVTYLYVGGGEIGSVDSRELAEYFCYLYNTARRK